MNREKPAAAAHAFTPGQGLKEVLVVTEGQGYELRAGVFPTGLVSRAAKYAGERLHGVTSLFELEGAQQPRQAALPGPKQVSLTHLPSLATLYQHGLAGPLSAQPCTIRDICPVNPVGDSDVLLFLALLEYLLAIAPLDMYEDAGLSSLVFAREVTYHGA